MSDRLLLERGLARTVEAHVVACAFDGRDASAGFATAEGSVHVVRRADGGWTDVVAHDGSALCLAPLDDGFVTGGDDGVLARVAGGEATPIARYERRWVAQCATAAPDRGAALIAVAVGRRVDLLDAAGTVSRSIEHGSTVTGIAFDAKGRRLAASHHNGASVAFTGSAAAPRVFEWKGSHIGVAIHPAAEAVVTAMQENALHGWRLSDGHNMRMSGYPSKTHALSFSRNGRWLATSGADTVVLWPFFGGGPMGKPPTELAGGGALCTRVAFNPRQDNVAGGFADGQVLLADVASGRVLPLVGAGRGAVTALAWSADGAALAFGTEDGAMAVIDLSAR